MMRLKGCLKDEWDEFKLGWQLPVMVIVPLIAGGLTYEVGSLIKGNKPPRPNTASHAEMTMPKNAPITVPCGAPSPRP